jgi:UDP-glucose 4-epimerase
VYFVVTGARGFVGLNVTRALSRAGHRVIAIDRSPLDEWCEAFFHDAKRIEHIEADLTAPGDLAVQFAGRRIISVVHAAALTATTLGVEQGDARQVVDVNVGATVEALRLAVDIKARRFVYVSSPAAFGNIGDGPLVDEKVVPRPTTLYGITKLAGEQITRRWGELHDLEAVSVRIAQPYGPGERATETRVRTSPIWEWLQAADEGRSLATGPLDRARDWTYVQDTSRGIALLATAGRVPDDLYHLSTGEAVTVGSVVEAFQQHFGPLDVDTEPPLEQLNPNIAAANRPALDPSLFKSVFGWKPSISLDAGVKRYVDWWTDTQARLSVKTG